MEEQQEKAKFFAQYLGQEVISYFNNVGPVITVGGINLSQVENDEYLLLTPLADITDEDKKHLENGPAMYRLEADYFRSKGYAVGWKNYSVGDLIEKGWVKWKN